MAPTVECFFLANMHAIMMGHQLKKMTKVDLVKFRHWMSVFAGTFEK